MNEARVVKSLREAWVNAYILPHLVADDVRAAKPADAWIARAGPRIVALVAQAIGRLSAGGSDGASPGTLSAVDLRKAEAHLREALDLRPPGAKALQVIRPTWPETLAQLKAQIEQAMVHTVKNPAPKLLAERAPQKQHLAYSAGRALYSSDVRPDSEADYDAIDGIAWRLSAPEGFPPVPRRGGIYSHDEAQAIRYRLLKSWEVLREIARAGAVKDAERAELGIPSEVVPRVLDTYRADSMRQWVTERLVGLPGDPYVPSAEDKSPKEFHAAILAWGRDRVFPVLAELARLDMGVFMPWPDPDAHVQALVSNDVTKACVPAVADRLYGIPRHTVDWSQWLGPAAKSIQPNHRVATPGYVPGTGYAAHWPLSKLIEVHRLSNRAYDDRVSAAEAAKQRDLAVALPRLKAMLARGLQFSKVNIERVLPGYKVHVREGWRSYTVGLAGPSGDGYLAAGAGSTIGAALAEIEGKLGLAKSFEEALRDEQARTPVAQAETPPVLTKPAEVRSLARRLQEGLAASGWQFFRDTQAPVWDDRASVAVDTVRGAVDMVLTNGAFYITFRWRAAKDDRPESGYFMVEWADQPGTVHVGTRRIRHVKFEALRDGLAQLATYLADNPGPRALPDTSARVAQLVDGFAVLMSPPVKQNPASPAPAVAAIQAALTPELLHEPWRSKALAGECHPHTGHCYVASEAYYHIHGGKAAGLKPMAIQHEGGPHWWIRDAAGRDIDLTAGQFSTPVPYTQGVGKGFLTKEPSKRAQVVMARVAGAPKANPAEPSWLPLAVVLAVEPHIEAAGVSEVARSPRGFLRAYEAAGGDPSQLATDAHSGQNWRVRRNAFVARHVAQAKANGEPWWEGDEPTGRHLALVAWAYSPTAAKLRAWALARRQSPK